MDYMTRLIDRLEAERLRRGLNKSEMSRKLGCASPSVYTNWIARGSIPKEYLGGVADMLGDTVPDVVADEVSASDSYDLSFFAYLSEEDKNKALELLLPSLGPESKALALSILLKDRN